jgi:predicted RNA binding protein YcfA (HicA-like mRNA interferase family)
MKDHGCFLHRHGGSHDIWLNPATRSETSVQRHREIPLGTVRAICKQLQIPPPR